MFETEVKNDALVIRMKHSANWEQWFLLMSDEHYDSKHCDRALLQRHHEEALERKAGIFKFGDTFDCMGGKWDKRSGKQDIRPEYQTGKYFDTIVEDAAKFYGKYKDNILLISDGNHEQSIQQKHEINILDSLAEKLSVRRGKFSGFIRFCFESGTSAGVRKSFVLYYNHGSGGNSPVTRGAIKTNRRQHDIEADFYVSGHIHTSMEIPRPRVKLNEACNVELYEPEHILLGTYKNDFMTGGWADSKEFSAPNLGGYWLRFFYRNHKIHYQIIRAKA
jgi:hypothetical protein